MDRTEGIRARRSSSEPVSWGKWPQIFEDIAHLLSEVDRLTAENERLQGAVKDALYGKSAHGGVA